MKATLSDGTVLEGTADELRAFYALRTPQPAPEVTATPADLLAPECAPLLPMDDKPRKRHYTPPSVGFTGKKRSLLTTWMLVFDAIASMNGRGATLAEVLELAKPHGEETILRAFRGLSASGATTQYPRGGKISALVPRDEARVRLQKLADSLNADGIGSNDLSLAVLVEAARKAGIA